MYFTCRPTTSVILSEIVVLSQSQPHEGQGKQHRWPFPLNQQLFQHVVKRSHMALIHTLTHLHLPTTTQPQFQIYDARCKTLKTTQQYSLILHLHLNWDIVIVQRFFFLLLFTVFYVVVCTLTGTGPTKHWLLWKYLLWLAVQACHVSRGYKLSLK